ncbi:MAG: daunorubicin resistance protein DrrA family transporter ATP-binding protein, partial [Jatrophihabitans sp.]|nr:daunorubicin resistance protein DrrA family transporter ATP-binding protein [Jatrophihabitans sp.]
AEGLRHRFGDVVALDGLDLEVEAGTVFGLLGPNGAGKTTLVRILSTLLRPTSGRATVLGRDVVAEPLAVRRRIGLAGQFAAVDAELTGRENVEMVGRLYRLPAAEARARAGEVLERFGLTEAADRRVSTYSGGMRRRLDLGASLIGRPPVLLLDEPTTGLDPQARHLLWERLFELKRQGVTLVLTTHYMDEAERLCDRLVVMDHGRVVATGSPRALIDTHVTREVLELLIEPGTGAAVAARAHGVADRIEVLADRLLCYTDDGERALARAHERGLGGLDALVRRATLEDVFLYLTGRSLIE